MFCDEALDAVEAIAAGELTPEGRISEHYATCPNCASALDSARALERMLSERGVPEPPPQFTTRTLARVRRARWRSEQYVDLGFNVAIGVILLAILGALWLLLRRTGLAAVGGDALDVFGRGLVTLAQRIAPSLPLYGGATALLVTALAIWWWAERDAQI
jgi:predicted anti-sigma-YlaC factor YlaD